MATGTVSIQAEVNGLDSGQKRVGPLTISVTQAVAPTENTVLSIGANTITKPTGATVAIIVPADANTGTLTLKGVTGDTGIPFDNDMPFILCPTGASFVITASAADTVQIVWL